MDLYYVCFRWISVYGQILQQLKTVFKHLLKLDQVEMTVTHPYVSVVYNAERERISFNFFFFGRVTQGFFFLSADLFFYVLTLGSFFSLFFSFLMCYNNCWPHVYTYVNRWHRRPFLFFSYFYVYVWHWTVGLVIHVAGTPLKTHVPSRAIALWKHRPSSLTLFTHWFQNGHVIIIGDPVSFFLVLCSISVLPVRIYVE